MSAVEPVPKSDGMQPSTTFSTKTAFHFCPLAEWMLDRIRYRIASETLCRLPAAPGAQAAAEPVGETMEGWSGSTGRARSWAELPAQAIKYVRRIEELTEAPVTLLSSSPERDDIILVRNSFEGRS